MAIRVLVIPGSTRTDAFSKKLAERGFHGRPVGLRGCGWGPRLAVIDAPRGVEHIVRLEPIEIAPRIEQSVGVVDSQAIDLALAPVAEVAIVGDPMVPATKELLAVVNAGYAPNRVVALRAGDGDTAVPLLEDRTLVKGRPAAYVCERFACQAPVTSPADLVGGP